MPKTPILWEPDTKTAHLEKDPNARKDWRQKEDMRMRRLDGITNSNRHIRFEQIWGDSEQKNYSISAKSWDLKDGVQCD